MILLGFLVRRVVALHDLDKLLKELLPVRPYIGYSPRLDVLLYELPVLLVHPESLEEELMLLVRPPSGIELHVLLSFLVSDMARLLAFHVL